LILLGAASAISTLACGWYRYTYPCGYTHFCNAVLSTALSTYALEHGGHYPFDDAGPAQSLAFLIPKYAPLVIECGKTVEPEAARQDDSSHGTLIPELCAWDYQPGLSANEHDRIALLWDKEPLGHNGQRTRQRERARWSISDSAENR
jgi:hypothetical protein